MLPNPGSQTDWQLNRLKEQSRIIDKISAELSQQRSDASQAQQKHLKWQEQLRDKLSSYREERKAWQSESAKVRGDLAEVKAIVSRQRDELAVVKNE